MNVVQLFDFSFFLSKEGLISQNKHDVLRSLGYGCQIRCKLGSLRLFEGQIGFESSLSEYTYAMDICSHSFNVVAADRGRIYHPRPVAGINSLKREKNMKRDKKVKDLRTVLIKKM